MRISCVAALVAVVVIGCKSDGPSGPPADVSGAWRVSEAITSQSPAISCADGGIITLTQSSGSATAVLTQAGTCVQSATGAFDNSGTASGTAQITATSVDLQVAQCRYHGTLTGSPPDTASGTVTCSGGGVTLTGTWHASRGGDVTAPIVAATVTSPVGDAYFVPGDSIPIILDAEDNERVAWVGYRVGGPGGGSDSVAATDRHFTHTFTAPTTSGWNGDLMVFARDAAGTPAQSDTMLPYQTGYVRYPTHSVALPARIRDIAYDAKRNVLYLSQPDSQRVAVLSLDTYTYEAPLAMPSVPASLDLSLSGDSLIIALRRAAALGIVDLTQANPTVDTAHLTFDTSLGRGPDALRVASNGKVLVVATCDGFGMGGSVISYSFTTHTTQTRSDASMFGDIVTCGTVLARTVDRSKVLVLLLDTCCPVNGSVYDGGSDAFGGTVGTVNQSQPPFAASTNRFLIGGTVYSTSLSAIDTVFKPSLIGLWPVATISPDGLYLYVGDPGVPGLPGFGYSKVRVTDGTVIERVKLPSPAKRLMVLPDGHTLIASNDSLPFSIETSRLFVVTLP